MPFHGSHPPSSRLRQRRLHPIRTIKMPGVPDGEDIAALSRQFISIEGIPSEDNHRHPNQG